MIAAAGIKISEDSTQWQTGPEPATKVFFTA
jgi:hypothetical protein